MLPILYPKTATKSDLLTTNGFGFLKDTLSCEVTRVLNGEYELQGKISTRDRLSTVISPMQYIKAQPSLNATAQIFEIYETETSENVIAFKAQHIRYKLTANAFSETYYPTIERTPTETWNAIQDYFIEENTDFTFASTISTTGIPLAAASYPTRIGDFLLGEWGSMLDTYGGEYEFDNFDIKLLQRVGADTGYCLRCGAGIESAEYSVNTDSMYSHVSSYVTLPLVMSTTGETVGEFKVYLVAPISTGGTLLPYNRYLSYDLTEVYKNRYPTTTVLRDDSSPDETSLANARTKLVNLTQRYISQNFNTLTKPLFNVKITPDGNNEQVRNLEIGDTVFIYYEPYEIETTARVISTTFDVLRENYSKVELGYTRKSLAALFSNKNIGGR